MLSVDKAIREHMKVFRWSLKVITPEDRAYILPTLLNEFISGHPNKLWEFNAECPECGAPANHTIRACETGLSYCSNECAEKHVNKKEGGY